MKKSSEFRKINVK